MAYPVKNFCGGSEYSIALEDGFLVIKNGLQGETAFVSSSVSLHSDCNGANTCSGSPLQKTQKEFLIVQGATANCFIQQWETVALDPEKFGDYTVETLSVYIQNILNSTTETLIQNAIQNQGEIFAQEQETGYTFGGKKIYKIAQVFENHVSGQDILHDLDAEQFFNLQLFAYDASFPLVKKVVEQNQQLGGDTVFENAKSNIIQEVILPAGYDTVLMYAEYTKTTE